MTHISLRLSGLLLIAGAGLQGAAIVMLSFKPMENQVFSPGISWLLLISSVLLLLSLPGAYAHQAASAGWPGLVGHALLQSGILLLVILASSPLLYPSLNLAPSENIVVFGFGISLTLGLLLTGIATIRAGVFPRWAGVLLLAATAGFFFVFFVAEFLPPIAGQAGSATFSVLLALALAWMGYSTLTRPVLSASPPTKGSVS